MGNETEHQLLRVVAPTVERLPRCPAAPLPRYIFRDI